MRHFSEDVAHFVRTSPYLALAKPASAARFLQGQLQAAEECAAALTAYPGVRIEPLEFFYTCLRSLGALDLPFFEALMSEHSWRGVVWGAWLATLEPSTQFLPALVGASNRWPVNDWLVRVAIASVREEVATDGGELVLAMARRCRELLREVKRPSVRLRRQPTEAEVAQMDREREQVRSTYGSLGAAAARAAMSGTLVGFYAEDYLTWAARCPRQAAE